MIHPILKLKILSFKISSQNKYIRKKMNLIKIFKKFTIIVKG
jgi:hypothetical protein